MEGRGERDGLDVLGQVRVLLGLRMGSHRMGSHLSNMSHHITGQTTRSLNTSGFNYLGGRLAKI